MNDSKPSEVTYAIPALSLLGLAILPISALPNQLRLIRRFPTAVDLARRDHRMATATRYWAQVSTLTDRRKVTLALNDVSCTPAIAGSESAGRAAKSA